MCVKKKNKIPCLAEGCDSTRLDFWQILEIIFCFVFFQWLCTEFSKKLRRYLIPDPLGIRESFREIAARRKRVNVDLVSMTFVMYCGAERAKRDRATGCGRFLSC